MKYKFLLIGPLPDPIDGCSYANHVFCKNMKNQKINFDSINTNTNIISSKQGNEFSLKKALYFIKVYFQIYKVLFARVVYFTPGQTFYGLLKYSPFILICWILRKPYIIHVHGNFLGTQYRQLTGYKKKIFHFLVSKASAGIVLSKSLRNNFEGLLSKDKIFVVENFAGNELYEKSENSKKRTDIPRIIYLSNLMEEKGILDLLEALLILKGNNIEFKATIAGSIESSIECEIKERFDKLGEMLNYVGVVKGQEKIDFLMNSNVFILPTYYKMEGQPISILEALATGNIIVTTNHAGIPDIISNKNGFLVNPKSPIEIAKVISSLSKNMKDEVKTYSVCNIKYAMENFTEEKFSNKILAIINSIL